MTKGTVPLISEALVDANVLRNIACVDPDAASARLTRNRIIWTVLPDLAPPLSSM
jgi:hypothetical protein